MDNFNFTHLPNLTEKEYEMASNRQEDYRQDQNQDQNQGQRPVPTADQVKERWRKVQRLQKRIYKLRNQEPVRGAAFESFFENHCNTADKTVVEFDRLGDEINLLEETINDLKACKKEAWKALPWYKKAAVPAGLVLTLGLLYGAHLILAGDADGTVESEASDIVD